MRGHTGKKKRTVQYCDRVYRLQNGMLIGQGTYECVVQRAAQRA